VSLEVCWLTLEVLVGSLIFIRSLGEFRVLWFSIGLSKNFEQNIGHSGSLGVCISRKVYKSVGISKKL
jgi:hypothetical protein